MRIEYAFKCVRYTISNVYTFVLAPREIVTKVNASDCKAVFSLRERGGMHAARDRTAILMPRASLLR
jgi:hypothetical protein